jgi:hypothetical protein
MASSRLIPSILRAIKLDSSFYEEVEQDASYDSDALIVVVVASLLGAFGALLRLALSGHFLQAILAFVVSAAVTLVGFFIWVWVATFVGTKLFGGTGQFGNVKRALGFAYAPQFLNILAFIPCLGGIIGLIAWVLSIIAAVIALRQSLNQDTTKAVLTAIVSAVVVFIITAIVTAIFAMIGIGGAAVMGAFNQ